MAETRRFLRPVEFNEGVTVRGALRAASASAPVGYTTGAGGTVTQATSISTGVTLSKPVGQITTVSGPSIAAGAETAFTVTNTLVTTTSVIVVNVATQFSDGEIVAYVKSIAAGSFVIGLTNVSSAAVSAGAAVINFAVLAGASS